MTRTGNLVLPEPARVVVADPDWKFQNFGMAKHGAARAHYPGSSVATIGAIPVGRWVAKDAVLFLWSNWAKLPEAFEVARAWGFQEYVTGWPWVKTTPSTGELVTGVGFWVQHASEPLLVFRRGTVPRRETLRVLGLLVGDGPDSIDRQFYAPRPTRAGSRRPEHSRKPVGVAEYIERVLPGPRLELYARRERPGWTCWGDALGVWLDERGATPCKPKITAPPAPRAKARRRAFTGIRDRGRATT